MTIETLSPQLATIDAEPYYQAVGGETALFEAAYAQHLPVLLKGPTGCGKTRFVEYMAWRLRRPLVTVACHDDLTTADLVGRYLIVGSQTTWVDGPLTAAVRAGAICYLDEVVEARKDTIVVIHPLADARRMLAVDKRGEMVMAPVETGPGSLDTVCAHSRSMSRTGVAGSRRSRRCWPMANKTSVLPARSRMSRISAALNLPVIKKSKFAIVPSLFANDAAFLAPPMTDPCRPKHGQQHSKRS